MAIIYAFLVLSLLGLALGFGLSFAEKKLSVEKDEKLLALEEIMPGANCGGCGYAGCSSYAEAVSKGEALPGLCQPGGKELAEKMSAIVGVEAKMEERKVAFVFCRGGRGEAKEDFSYNGIEDCNDASLLFGGPYACKDGCLKLGSCIKVCNYGALSKDENGDIVVDKEKCTGCGACTRVCPKKTIRLVPYSAKYFVACSNHDKGAISKKNCSLSCIGCKICEVKVQSSPFTVEGFLSHNDYSKDQSNAKEALEKCPQCCIVER